MYAQLHKRWLTLYIVNLTSHFYTAPWILLVTFTSCSKSHLAELWALLVHCQIACYHVAHSMFSFWPANYLVAMAMYCNKEILHPEFHHKLLACKVSCHVICKHEYNTPSSACISCRVLPPLVNLSSVSEFHPSVRCTETRSKKCPELHSTVKPCSSIIYGETYW